MTEDETWVNHFDLEAKKQCSRSTLAYPVKFKRVSSAGKVMAFIFWDSQGIIVDYLEEGRRIKCILCRRTKAAASGDYERKKRKVDLRCSALA